MWHLCHVVQYYYNKRTIDVKNRILPGIVLQT